MQTHWSASLSFRITPKCGPLRVMETLLDASRALTEDLPAGYLKRSEWSKVGWLLVQAAETGEDWRIRDATEELVSVLDREGWMSAPPAALQRPRAKVA